MRPQIDDRTDSYIRTALWSSTVSLPCDESDLIDGRMDVDDGHCLYGIRESDPLDDHFECDDLTDDAVRTMCADVAEFFNRLESADVPEDADCPDCDNLLECANLYADDDRIAHDFWLTRNGHGSGFWDGDYSDGHDSGPVGNALTAIAESFGECHVYIGDDARLHVFNG